MAFKLLASEALQLGASQCPHWLSLNFKQISFTDITPGVVVICTLLAGATNQLLYISLVICLDLLAVVLIGDRITTNAVAGTFIGICLAFF